jgi:hypothetical protein
VFWDGAWYGPGLTVMLLLTKSLPPACDGCGGPVTLRESLGPFLGTAVWVNES